MFPRGKMSGRVAGENDMSGEVYTRRGRVKTGAQPAPALVKRATNP